MAIEKLPAPVLITRQAALQRLADTLRGEKIIAVDTESNSLYAYQEQVCLIQFTARGIDYLVDPLALDDLSPLAPVFSDPAIEKVFHAAEYDLICLKRDFGYTFNNLFDTMVAARILGRELYGLGAILEEEFGVQVDKRYQRANWGQRPLPPELLAYARLDTHFLIPLRNRFMNQLQEEGKWPLAQEDFRRLTELNGYNGRENNNHTAACWRVSGSYDLTPQQAAVLLELCKYRDEAAQQLNRPLFKVINDRTLLIIASEMPRQLRDLEHIPGMTRRQIERHGMALLAAVQRGLNAEPIHPPRTQRPSEQYLERLDALRQWRKQTAERLGVKSDVILPRDLMTAIAERNPHNLQELEGVLKEVPWRFSQFGQEILEAMKRAHE